ncbi:NAD(P)-dependent oxidoreductase [Streptomyces alfalfae]|uniref:6-phosphogluconate dehydrogenase n=1 Tax=Streptomyces alfalfae TaxID=1642299 RepID=A0A1P8TI33_9ACTN|nr:NAD(P)-binding domain-containing protein [Streptomyces alfalfae]AYA17694.1 NAD(P)-dependent oxidoreductase [Streptomyces fradiae]APY87287.1 6-phosphogluconate dehydrogenase [Streptomyces alfalfae]QQC90412.1 NAD(P)-dependent oxidoreductase [Streptomyces alfalfae]QUI32885.1 NAD(P)-dependent oxidoreductase [Streptomyces alfalfae]RXX44905.1 NAD(P)-dependent oxidoreductase [Streptomyces alfalfae]
MSSASQSVTVIGLGPMGQAMAAAYLDRGYRVTLWNRTPSRADALVERGATLAATAEEALRANELVVLSLTGYDAMYAILEPAKAAVAGRTLVNLSSDTPEKARAGAGWVTELGGTHLTGGVLCPPPLIGTADASTFYSGPREAYDEHRAALEVITGRTDYRGEDPGLAALMYQLNMAIFWPAITAYWHTVALAAAHGIKATEIAPYASENFAGMGHFIDFYATRIDAGNHAGDVDRTSMGLASMEHVVHTTADAGVDTAFPEAVHDIFRRLAEAGHGADSYSRAVELMRS